jgi:tetratricopeptide (TPR) repeat protein
MTRTYDVFLSYARTDSLRADALQVQLSALGITSWRDRDNISPTEYSFTERIAEAIGASRCVIAILSKSFLESYYCYQEIFNARISTQPKDSIIRFLLLDAHLDGHPIVDVFSNSDLINPSNIATELQTWMKTRPKPSGRRSSPSFSVASQELTAWLKEKVEKRASLEYIRTVVEPFAELESSLHDLHAGQLDQALKRIEIIEKKISSLSDVPLFLQNAAKSRLAYAYNSVGRFRDAVTLRAAAFTSQSATLGRSNFETVLSANALIHSLRRSGDSDNALRLAHENLSVTNTNYGESHTLSQMTANSLAGILIDQGDYESGATILERVHAAILSGSVKRDSDEAQSVAMNYGFCLMKAGDLDGAWQVLTGVKDIYISGNSPSPIDVAQVDIKLAECALRDDRHQEARDLAHAAMSAFECLTIEHPLRVFGAVVALQCFHAGDYSEDKRYTFDTHINPLLESDAEASEQVRGFLDANPELYPAGPTEMLLRMMRFNQ